MSERDELRDERDAYLRRVRAAIRADGWTVIALMVGDTGLWAYTVGLTEAGLPELCVAGVAPNSVRDLLDGVAKQSLAAELVAGQRVSGCGSVVAEFTVTPVPENRLSSVLPVACGLYPPGSALSPLRAAELVRR